ncbi:MAG: hypothetical protein R3B06_16980 [Kofleriaceae bacterium]
MTDLLGKLTIMSLDGVGGPIIAQYNPKELAMDKSVPWQKSPTASGDTPELQFTSAEGRSLSFELFFNGYEDHKNVHTTYIEPLLVLTKVMDPSGPEDKRRPPRVQIRWAGFIFEGVIESVSTKYTMFLPDGSPCRCTASVKCKEASRATGGKAK